MVGVAPEETALTEEMMAYFPNGTAGMDYEERYCVRCIHDDDNAGCPIMLAHNLYNYDECNNPRSILHLLIPRSKDGLDNDECRMFVARDPARGLPTYPLIPFQEELD